MKPIVSFDTQKYSQKASEAKAVYKKRYQEYLEKRTPEDIALAQTIRQLKLKAGEKNVPRVPKDVNAPEGYLNAYMLFNKDVLGNPSKQLELLGTNLDSIPNLQRMKAIARAYQNLDSAEKQVRKPHP